MGKLDTIYKVFKAMQSKKILSGNSTIVSYKNNNEIVFVDGTFTYNIEEGLATLNATSKLNLDSIKKDFDFKGDIQLSDSSSSKENKLPSVTTLLKIFSNLKVEDINGQKVLSSSLIKIINKVKKDYLKENLEHIDYDLKNSEIENLKTITKIILKEFFNTNYDDIILKATLNSQNEITNLTIEGIGADNFELKVKLEY